MRKFKGNKIIQSLTQLTYTIMH